MVAAIMKRVSFLVIILVCCTYGVTSVGEDFDEERFETFDVNSNIDTGSNNNEDAQNTIINNDWCAFPPCKKSGSCPRGSRLNGPPRFACEQKINEQIHEELKASDIYLSMAAYFKRFDVSLRGFEQFFKASSDEERGHAKKFMDYQNRRGGIVKSTTQNELPSQVKNGDWFGALEATKQALDLEKVVLEKLKAVHKCGADNDDANLQDFIESEFLTEQYESIEELSNMVTKLTRLGCGVGLHMFDEELKHHGDK
ncbi:soma ferritin-like isoform X2 [Tubulanus polymorphus]